MTARKAVIGFSLAGLLCFLIAFGMLYYAGRVGDVKTGTGDSGRAFQIETRALLFLPPAALFLGTACGLATKGNFAFRLFVGAMASFISVMIGWIVGMQVEILGVGVR